MPAKNTSQTSLDQLFETLVDENRRRIVYYLKNIEDGTAEFEELVDYIFSVTSIPEQHEDVLVQLVHVHLPKLTESGLIEYDSRSATVKYGGQSALDPLLVQAERLERE